MFSSIDITTFNKKSQLSLALVLGIVALLITIPVLAAPVIEVGENIDWWQMGMTLLGGLAIFLFGM